jgi:adenylate cyclase
MRAQEFKRKLTAVFSADVAGYSRLMGEDESATVKTLEAYKQVMFALIQQHRGRLIDSPGDNLLAEFASVVDAVQCGVAVQNELKARNAACPKTGGCSSGSGSTWGMSSRRGIGSTGTA